MDLSQLTTVLRTYHRLNPDGEWNDELSQALVHLVDTSERPVSPVGDYSPQASTYISDSKPDAPSSGSNRQEFNLTPNQKPSAKHEPAQHETDRQRNHRSRPNLVALKSILDLIASEADIEMDEVGATQPERDHQSPDLDLERVRPPVENLFPETRVRAILREMAMVPTPSGRIHVETAVNLMASGQPLCKLPEKILTGMPPAVHWLFDASPSMLPYSRDKQQLARTAPRLLGNERTHIADFIGDPLKGVRLRGDVRWAPIHWPSRHSALVVVSDLGIREPAGSQSQTERTWEVFLEEAVLREINVVLLNPYNPDRWPKVAHHFAIALAWDSATGVQKLRRNRRRAATT